MRKYSINENYVASNGQQVFNIEKPFVNDTISIFVNGILQVLGENKDYLTVQDTGKIIFNKPLTEGDIVSVISTIASNKINLEIISSGKADKPNSLYKKYGTVKRFKPNNVYEVQLCLDKDIIKWNFVSHLNPLSEGDIVSVISTVASKKINLEIISPGKADKPNALYKKYGTVKRFKPNNVYEVQLCLDKDIIKWNFISHINPLFVSSKKIWEDIGEFIEGFTERYINSMIYRNSVEVIELIDELANQEEAIENVTYEINEDGDYTTTYRAVKNWVKFKTEIELVMARYYGISYRYGSIRKEIGDISIEKSTKLPYIDNLLDRLKDQFEEADKVIRGLNIVASAVKANDNYSYEDWERTTNF